MLFSELLEFHKQIFIGIHIAVKGFILLLALNRFPPCGEIVIFNYPSLERPNFL